MAHTACKPPKSDDFGSSLIKVTEDYGKVTRLALMQRIEIFTN